MSEAVVRRVANEPEARAVVAYLAAESCPATLRRHELVGYPGLVEPPGVFAEVLVAEADLERARQLLADWDASTVGADDLESQAIAATMPPDRPPPPSRSRVPWLAIALFVSMGFNVYAVSALGGSYDASYAESVDAAGNRTALHRFHDDTDVPYSVEAYAIDGELLARFTDQDEDGWYEQTFAPVTGNASGISHQVTFDADEDGRLDRSSVFAGDEERVRFEDADEDGLYETAIDLREDLVLTDTDDDGMYDSLRCSAQASDARVVRVSRVLCTPTVP